MKTELENVINLEIRNESNQEFSSRISSEYLNYYFSKSEITAELFRKLFHKYNDQTILKFLGSDGYPDDYLHLSLGHNMGEKTLTPMLDNGGGIYPPDMEIGNLIVDPDLWGNDETDEESELRWKYHGLIFFAWLSIVWMQVEGYKSKIVVKTTENNSGMSFYLNDFQFDANSKFDLEPNWVAQIGKYNMKTIDLVQLINNIKKEFGS